jgi:hypothetical protein
MIPALGVLCLAEAHEKLLNGTTEHRLASFVGAFSRFAEVTALGVSRSSPQSRPAACSYTCGMIPPILSADTQMLPPKTTCCQCVFAGEVILRRGNKWLLLVFSLNACKHHHYNAVKETPSVANENLLLPLGQVE